MNPSVTGYIRKNKKWQSELEALRTLALDCELTEEMKWMSPCYTFQESNVILLHIFKEYCALTFFKGVLLKDADGILSKPGENTQSARLIRFTSAQEITGMEATLKTYIREAIELEKSGSKVDFKKTTDFAIPEELQGKLEELPTLKTAFDALTPGRQRAYLPHFSAPKQSKTRASRIEKCVAQILDGKGLNDG